jgi:SAM-dependent methyltransferase
VSAPSATLRGFGAVDAEAAADELVLALDEVASLPAVQRLRAAATELLAPGLGDSILDVGCGTGEVVRTHAGIVGPAGCVVGVEASETMLAEARRRTRDRRLPVEFRRGDATALDVADAAFDGARCERVFQHLAEPAAAMAELIRVTKAGGRVAVIDTDWGMHAVHGADPRLTARILGCWAEHATNGWSGRRLPALFADAGIPEPRIVAETFVTTDPRRPWQPPFTVIAATAVQAGAVTAGESREWLAQLRRSGSRGHFLWAATMFAVGGVRP